MKDSNQREEISSDEMKSQKGMIMAPDVTNWKTVFIGLILLLMIQNIQPELSNLMDSTITPCPILYPYFIGYVLEIISERYPDEFQISFLSSLIHLLFLISEEYAIIWEMLSS